MKDQLVSCFSNLPLLTIYDAEGGNKGKGGQIQKDLDGAILEAIFKAGQYKQSISK